MRFQKKPVIIEAIQYTGENIEEIIKFTNGAVIESRYNKTSKHITIPTLEGDHRANPGDWIIKGVKGEFYPCKPDIFDQTYEAVHL